MKREPGRAVLVVALVALAVTALVLATDEGEPVPEISVDALRGAGL